MSPLLYLILDTQILMIASTSTFASTVTSREEMVANSAKCSTIKQSLVIGLEMLQNGKVFQMLR